MVEERDKVADRYADAKAELQRVNSECLQEAKGAPFGQQEASEEATQRFLGFEVPLDLLAELAEIDDVEALGDCERTQQQLETYQAEGKSTIEDAENRKADVEKVRAELYQQAEGKTWQFKLVVTQARAGTI